LLGASSSNCCNTWDSHDHGLIGWQPCFPQPTPGSAQRQSVPGERICHARGLRQGYPLLPMLFLLVMEIINALIRKADEWSLWEPLEVRGLPYHASLCADDLILLTSPSHQDLQLTRPLLSLFERASGLASNFAKCQMALIRCVEDHLALASAEFPCQMVALSIKYLRIPLSVSKLPRVVFQSLVDLAANKLPT
jgi:hypothetical protein